MPRINCTIPLVDKLEKVIINAVINTIEIIKNIVKDTEAAENTCLFQNHAPLFFKYSLMKPSISPSITEFTSPTS